MLAIDMKVTEELKRPKPKYDFALVQQLMKIIGQTIAASGQPNRGNFSVRHLMNATAANMKDQLDGPKYDSAQQLLKMIAVSIKKHLDQPIYDYVSAQNLMKIIAANIREWPRQWERDKSLGRCEPLWKLSPRFARTNQ